MALVLPVVSTLITPVISVATPLQITGIGASYEQFLQSLGSYNYGAEFFYMSANNYQQVGQPVYYNHFDASGNSVTTFLPFAVDPYQSQPSIFYETESDQVVFTGMTALSFQLFPKSTVYFKFFSTITYVGSELDNQGDNAFQQLEETQGISFFDDYCNYLIDNQ